MTKKTLGSDGRFYHVTPNGVTPAGDSVTSSMQKNDVNKPAMDVGAAATRITADHGASATRITADHGASATRITADHSAAATRITVDMKKPGGGVSSATRIKP